MHFNSQSFLALTLAVSTLFANSAMARPHGQAHGGIHSSYHAKRHFRTGPWKRDALQTLQSEVQSFEDFMTSFVQAGTTDSSAISQLQSQIQAHVQAVQTFASNAGSTAPGSIPQLQADTGAFKGWVENWVQNVAYTSSASAMSELSNELVSYEQWLNAWLGISGPSTGTAPTTQPTSVPVPAPTGATTLLTATIVQSSTDVVINTQTVTGSPPVSSLSAPAASPSAASSSSASEVVTPVPASPSSAGNTPTSAASSPAAPSPSTSGGSGSGSSGSPKLAAWWGQTSSASSYGLSSICSDPNYDIVMLSFLNNFFSEGGMPTLNLGPATGEPSASQTAAGATGLFNGDDLTSDIQACQSSGKKVMLTLGGAAGYSQSQFASDDQATEFADTIWNLFLGGQSDLRPFGDMKLDGIDVDNENKDQTGYTAFVSALRNRFGEDSSKQYFISGAPQCPQPDESIPMDAMRNMDFVRLPPLSLLLCSSRSLPPLKVTAR